MYHPFVLLTLAMLFFSGNFIVGKSLAGEVPPFTMAFFRFFMGALFLLPIAFKEVTHHVPLWKAEWKPLLGLALTGIVLFNSMLYMSVNYTTAINAAIVDALTPVIAIVFGYFLIKERMTRSQSIGVVLSLIGVMYIITRGSLDVLITLSFNIGDIIMLVGVMFWALYSILIKQHGHKFPIYGGLVMTMIVGIIILFPLALYEWMTQGFPHIATWPIVLALLYIGLFPSALALLAWYKGVAAIGPAKASMFFNLVPLFTTILAVIFLNETFGWVQLIGGILVITGVYISTKKKKTTNRIHVHADVHEKQESRVSQ